MPDEGLSTQLQLMKQRLATMESSFKDIHVSIKDLETWKSTKQGEDSNAEQARDKTVKWATLSATIMLVMTALISIIYKGPTQ